jgi:hypothetical protein
VAENVDAGEVEPLGVDAQEPGGAQLVADTAPVLAKSTAGVELAGKVERATAAKLEASMPWARQGWAQT